MKWENVYVFISSTFNDMHAERDYLIKRTFPQLRIWCAQRKLKLMDIDLRWGVSEADAQENKRVVEVCLKNIDKCRPFFLGFLGQRRGWVPERQDVNPGTFMEFPGLEEYLGHASVTELEIIHALLHPLAADRQTVRHSRFYFRSNSYVRQIKDKDVRNLYAPASGLFLRKDRRLEEFKEGLKKQFPVYEYSGEWNAQQISPELKSVQGRDLSQGRLENFLVDRTPLKDHVLEWLREAIAEEFPEHMTVRENLNALELELERQDAALFQACGAFIPRPEEEQTLLDYVSGEERRPLLLWAEAGAGKTSLLADMIQKRSFGEKVYYRLAGVTADSGSSDRMILSWLEEMKEDGLLSAKDLNRPARELKQLFGQLLEKAGEKQKFLIILDGLDQLKEREETLFWIPASLPGTVKMIISVKADFLEHFEHAGKMLQHHMGFLDRASDKELMIRSYLGQFLKDIDDRQIAMITRMKGSNNPLYLKIVLNELRQYGSFDSLLEKLQTDYGSDPRQAFGVVIARIREEMRQLYFHRRPGSWGDTLTEVFLGTLACSQEGVPAEEYPFLFGEMAPEAGQGLSQEEILDDVYGLIRQLEPYLTVDGDRINFLYESFRLAVLDVFGKQKERFHRLLAGLYSKKAKAGHESRDYVQLLYHLVRMEGQQAAVSMRDPALWMEVLTYADAWALSEAFLDGAALGLEGFEEMGGFFAKTGARLNVNPQSLFMELERYTDSANPVAADALAQACNFLNLTYFEPLDEPGTDPGDRPAPAALLQREYIAADKYEKIYPADACFVLKRRREIHILNRKTLKEERVLKPECGSGEKMQCTARKDRLYVLYESFDSGSVYRTELYSLPELERIGDGKEWRTQESFGAGWSIQGAGDHLYGFFEQRREDESQIVRVVDFTAGEVIFRKHLTDFYVKEMGALEGRPYKYIGQQHQFAGDYLILGDKGNGRVTLVSLICRRAVWENEGLMHSSLYAASEGDRLCFKLSAYGQKERIFWVQTKEDGSFDISERQLELPSCSRMSLAGGRIFELADGSIAVWDEQFHLQGYANLQMSRPMQSWAGRMERWEDSLIVYWDDRIQYYPWQEFLQALSREKHQKAAGILYDSMLHDGWHYTLKNPLVRYNPLTGQKEEEEEDDYRKEYRYDSDILYRGKYLTGVNHRSGVYCVKNIDTMTLALRARIAPQENKWLERVFMTEQGRLGLVLTEKETCEREIFEDRRLKAGQFTHVEIRLCRIGSDRLAEEERWRIGDEAEALDMGNLTKNIPQRMAVTANGDIYLVLPYVYAGAKDKQLCIYRLSDRRCVYRHTYQGLRLEEDGIANKSIFKKDNRVVFYVNESPNGYQDPDFVLYEICLSPFKVFRISVGGAVIGKPSEGDKVVIYAAREEKLQIYSLRKHGIVQEIGLDKEDQGRRFSQAVFLGSAVVLREEGSSVVTVYDAESGQKLFSQRMEVNVGALCADEKAGILCSMRADEQRSCWRLMGPKPSADGQKASGFSLIKAREITWKEKDG